MKKTTAAALAAAALLAMPRGNGHNLLKLPSFRGVAEVRASIPGRIRLYMPAIALRPEAAEAMKTRMISTGAVLRVEINSRTATALILYDPDQAEAAVVEGAAIRLMGLEEELRQRPESGAEKALKTLRECLDHGILEATNGLLDGRMLAGSALTAAGLRSAAQNGVNAPGAMTLFWWAFNIFRKRGNG